MTVKRFSKSSAVLVAFFSVLLVAWLLLKVAAVPVQSFGFSGFGRLKISE